jgi:hypothetical protein
MSEEEILNHKPKSGNYDVRAIIGEYRTFDEARAGGVDLDTAMGALRLVGRSMMNEKKCERYCAAKGICDALETQFPQEGGEDA